MHTTSSYKGIAENWEQVGETIVLARRVSTEDLTKDFRGICTLGVRFQVSRENQQFKVYPPLNRGTASSQESYKEGRVELGGGNERRLKC